ncbi:hypothetical protein [Flagellimonas aquimarina]|uniref:hypothetical protein n=1 Tax=Flagellimonas aquimarina TaxID=2201895 RepID=UPI001403E5C7|nr:hypothetical protein [Allomuricauda koreensis]
MRVIIIENGSKEQIEELKLKTLPRNGEYVEFKQTLYSIHKVIHTENDIKLLVIRVR